MTLSNPYTTPLGIKKFRDDLKPIVLKETTITRLVFVPFIVENNGENLLKGSIIHQRKLKNDIWEDVRDIELSKLKAGEYAKIDLNSGAIKNLLEGCEGIKMFFEENGFTYEDLSLVKYSDLEIVKGILGNPDREKVIQLVLENNLLPDDVLNGIEFSKKKQSIQDFGNMLHENLLESKWQEWFENKQNFWVLGTDFVQVLEERRIDVENIADFLMQSYDGFLDIIEIKRPEGKLKFWAEKLDHENLVPHQDLVKAITQSLNYLYEIERESNSQKFFERVGGIKVVKPRITLVFGRSFDWGDDEKQAYRILNSSYHNLSIITFDQVLERAEKILGYKYIPEEVFVDDLPF